MTTYNQSLRGRFISLRGFEQSTRGRFRALRNFTQPARGRFLTLRGFASPLRGRFLALRGFTSTLRGRFLALRAFAAPARGRYRVADEALKLYRLYIGLDSPPDPDLDSPVAESATLPFTSPAQTDVGPGKLYLLTGYRNEYGLDSLARWGNNSSSALLEIDDDDLELPPRPSAPVAVAVLPIAAAEVRITARYDYLQDDEAARGDTWRVYLAVGEDPDPAVDPPLDLGDAAAMVLQDGSAALEFDTHDGDYDDADDIRVLVRVLRSDDAVESDNLDLVTCEADSDGPDQPPLPMVLVRDDLGEQQ